MVVCFARLTALNCLKALKQSRRVPRDAPAPDCRPKQWPSSVWLKFSPMRNAHFLFSKWRQVAKATGNFCFAKSSHGSNAVGRCVARHHRCRKFCYAEVSPAGGESSSFGVSFGQTLRSRFAVEPREAFASFFAPTCSKKKRTNAFVQFLFDAPFVYNLSARACVRIFVVGWTVGKQSDGLGFGAEAVTVCCKMANFHVFHDKKQKFIRI